MKKIIKNPLIILAVGVMVLAGSSVGATTAAINNFSEAKEVDFSTANVSVQVKEGATADSTKAIEDMGVLEFANFDKENFHIGQSYDEFVNIQNDSSKYSEYVRVTVTKYWVVEDSNGNLMKDTTLDPSLINLGISTDAGWVQDSTYESSEKEVYYLTSPLAAGAEVNLLQSVTIDNKVTQEVELKDALDKSGQAIKATVEDEYLYDGATFYVEVKADAVQVNNAKEAIYGAWGIDVECNAVDGGNITSIQGVSCN